MTIKRIFLVTDSELMDKNLEKLVIYVSTKVKKDGK